jgi:hypothetical protein
MYPLRHERTILVLTILFCLGMGGMLWYVSRLQSNLIASIALQDASLYAQALAEFRTLYTSEVVETMRSRGIEVTHDHATREGAIPLPATLTMLIGKRIGAMGPERRRVFIVPIHFPGGRRRVACTMHLARKRGALCNITPTNPSIALRNSTAFDRCALRRRI